MSQARAHHPSTPRSQVKAEVVLLVLLTATSGIVPLRNKIRKTSSQGQSGLGITPAAQGDIGDMPPALPEPPAAGQSAEPSEQCPCETGPTCSATSELLKHARRTLSGMYSVVRIMVSFEHEVYN